MRTNQNDIITGQEIRAWQRHNHIPISQYNNRQEYKIDSSYKPQPTHNTKLQKLNQAEIMNASYLIDNSKSNNMTVNQNTLNNLASHNSGAEKQINKREVPKGFYQRTYRDTKRIQRQLLLHKLRKQLHITSREKHPINRHQQRNAERDDNRLSQLSIKQMRKWTGPTL